MMLTGLTALLDGGATPCAQAVDTWGTRPSFSGTGVDGGVVQGRSVDSDVRRPRSVLTPLSPVTCDDARRTQFPQPLLLRRILLKKRTVLVEAGDEGAVTQHQMPSMIGGSA
jgi:hypothetical protein